MRGPRRLLSQFLRGRIVVALVLYALPFVALILLGSLWLFERGWFLWFALASVAVIALYRIIAWVLTRRALARVVRAPEAAAPLVSTNPEWSDRETAAFLALSDTIREDLAAPVPWPDLQPMALRIVGQAAATLSGGRRGALDFSIPEAILLVDRVLTRLRGDIRRYVPLADTVPISALVWLWSHRARLGQGARVARDLWRLRRLAFNPPVGILQEVQGLLMGEATGTLQAASEVAVQRLILEEVARAAVDLHAGLLRFTDTELLEIELASHRADLQDRAAPDVPLRVVVVGQVSAGKTSLINALAGADLGETDMAPTTPGRVTHAVDLDEAGFTFVDTAGIDGTAARAESLLADLLQADLVLWAARANRPARAADADLLARLRAALAADPRRRAPRIIVAMTAADMLVPGWPHPEHHLPQVALQTIGMAMGAIAQDLGVTDVVPVSAISPEWNIDALESLVLQHAADALMVQRNRRRLEGQASASVAGEAAKGLRGAWAATRLIGKGWRGRS